MRPILAAVIFFSAVSIAAQAPKPPDVVHPKDPYSSTEAQLLATKEENLQLKANAASEAFQKQMADMRSEYAADEAKLTAWIESVRKANGWDASYEYDRAKDQWVHNPEPPVKK